MRKTIYYTTLILLGLGIFFFGYKIMETMVQVKYKTGDSTDCISSVLGQNSCITIDVLKGLIIVSVLVMFALVLFRKKILGTTKHFTLLNDKSIGKKNIVKTRIKDKQ